MKTKLPIPLKFNPRIKGNDYVRILGTNRVISRFETTKGLNYENTNYALMNKRKRMPSTRLFMPYFVQVIRANNGELVLYDANNKPIPSDQVEELYKKLTTDSWSWLNNYFSKDELGNFSNQSYLSFKKDGNKKTITLEESPLEKCVMENCVVDLEFNSQGFPIRKSSEQKYAQEKNINFLYPRENSVARFNAYSNGAYLSCIGDPSVSIAGLGVFECAEGAPEIFHIHRKLMPI